MVVGLCDQRSKVRLWGYKMSVLEEAKLSLLLQSRSLPCIARKRCESSLSTCRMLLSSES